MKKIIQLILLIYLISYNYIINASEKFFKIHTGHINGVYYPIGKAICNTINRNKTFRNLYCSAKTTNGSFSNIEKVIEDPNDLAFTQEDVLYEYIKNNPKKAADLRVIMSPLEEKLSIIVNKNSKISSFFDLKDKSIATGYLSSGSYSSFQTIIQELGWGKSDFKNIKRLKMSEQVNALCSNMVDAIAVNTGHPNGYIQDAVHICDAKIIGIEENLINKITSKHTFFFKSTIDGEIYNEDKIINTIGTRTLLIANKKFNNNYLYEILNLIDNNFSYFLCHHAALSYNNFSFMFDRIDNLIPLHAAAKNYISERNKKSK